MYWCVVHTVLEIFHYLFKPKVKNVVTGNILSLSTKCVVRLWNINFNIYHHLNLNHIASNIDKYELILNHLP